MPKSLNWICRLTVSLIDERTLICDHIKIFEILLPSQGKVRSDDR